MKWKSADQIPEKLRKIDLNDALAPGAYYREPDDCLIHAQDGYCVGKLYINSDGETTHWESNDGNELKDVIDWILISDLTDCDKDDQTDWQQEAVKQCAAAGELRIAIAERLEEIRTSIMTTKRQLAREENSAEVVDLQWKIRLLQQQADWMEAELTRHTPEGGNNGTGTKV